MYDQTFSKLANHQIRHQAAHKVGCQSGDCIWLIYSSLGLCVSLEFAYGQFNLPHGFVFCKDLSLTRTNWRDYSVFRKLSPQSYRYSISGVSLQHKIVVLCCFTFCSVQWCDKKRATGHSAVCAFIFYMIFVPWISSYICHTIFVI